MMIDQTDRKLIAATAEGLPLTPEPYAEVGRRLGLPEAELPYAALRDPFGIAFWPSFKGRDGCRTPMPWNDDAHAGFSSAAPWLPIPDGHRALAVTRQLHEAHSPLQRLRAFLAWRRDEPALRWGSIELLPAAVPLLMFVRRHAGSRLLALFNLDASPQTAALPAGHWQAIEVPGLDNGQLHAGSARLPAHGVLFARARA